MSRENVEIARAIYAAWQKGDFSSVAWAAPDIEFAQTGPDAEVVRGLGAMRRSWREWLMQWEEFQTEAREFVDAGNAVVVLNEFRGRGKSSGVSIDSMPGSNVFWFRDGKVVRLAVYANREDALEAAGLRE